MTYTEKQVREIYSNELSAVRSLQKEDAHKIVKKYTKKELLSMAGTLYGEDSIGSMQKLGRAAIVHNICRMIESVDRALRMKP